MNNTSDNLYKIENLSFSYKLGTQKVSALNNISLTIKRNSFVCLVGPSGSGKSTLLNLLGLIENLQEGYISFDNKAVSEMSEREKNSIRRFKIGFIFQEFHLFPALTAEENIEFFLIKQKLPKKIRKERVEEALNDVNLWSQRTQKPLNMSGGQRQRVAIARALAKKPAVIIADEPTASLDQKTGKDIMTILKELNNKRKVNLILSSHDPMVQSFVEEKIFLADGALC